MNQTLIVNTQQKYSDNVVQSKRIVIVGTRYLEHDQHIWEPIGRSKAEVLIVDPNPEETHSWALTVGLRAPMVISKSFDGAVWDIAKFIRPPV